MEVPSSEPEIMRHQSSLENKKPLPRKIDFAFVITTYYSDSVKRRIPAVAPNIMGVFDHFSEGISYWALAIKSPK